MLRKLWNSVLPTGPGPLSLSPMSRTQVLFLYNLLLPVFFIIAFPAWLLKMWKRGGFGTGLLERFALFKQRTNGEPQGVVYVHAVSVGEVLIALKLIDVWMAYSPELKVVLAATTSTGHEVARNKAPETVRVIYSPVDFGFLVRSVFRRFSPNQVVLIESEAWPNLLNVARKMEIPVSMVNARLSGRSEARFKKFSSLTGPLFEMVSLFCVQNQEDAERFRGLGIPEQKIKVSGSIKFDPSGGAAPRRRDEFERMLQAFGTDRPVVMAASTHPGEEKLLGEALLASKMDALYVVVPRHAERRSEVSADLSATGFEVVLRSDFSEPQNPAKACFVVDSTGELRDWTAHADLLLIGKSWLGVGGQNPAEAIIAGVPVVCGPEMSNFEPLVTMLREAGGIEMLSSARCLPDALSAILENPEKSGLMADRAQEVLSVHEHAVMRTIEFLPSGNPE